MNEQAQSDLLQEHEVLFLDFMGFAAAVQQWDDHRMGELIRVLASIADAQSAFDVKGESQSDGSYKITSRPEITTFSDHIVVSYPRIAKPSEITIELWEVLSNGWVGMVREQMQKITAQVAIAALGLGLLVRGGLSRGKLYHHGRVVVGEAMVDAYQLESKVARDARVIVSERISDNDRLFIDTDGKRKSAWPIDFCHDFSQLCRRARQPRSTSGCMNIGKDHPISRKANSIRSRPQSKLATKSAKYLSKAFGVRCCEIIIELDLLALIAPPQPGRAR